LGFVKLLNINSIPPNELKYLIIEDHEIMLINKWNDFFCYDARCTHAGAPLFEGKIEDDLIICPWHGARFRIVDGSIVDGPISESLKSHPLNIKNNFLYVDTKGF
jgi:nitrite reductase/ring-hydroxylating ferredoxin subunit